MKTAISLPDKLYDLVEKYLEQSDLSRSELYVAAISDFIERAQKKEMKNITEKINAVCDNLDTSINDQVKAASKRLLLDSEW